MWTREDRARYDRRVLRYPSDLTGEEWPVLAPLIPRAKRGGNKRSVDERSLINGLLYILSTGCQRAGRSEGFSATQHAVWLFSALGVGRHLGEGPSRSLSAMLSASWAG